MRGKYRRQSSPSASSRDGGKGVHGVRKRRDRSSSLSDSTFSSSISGSRSRERFRRQKHERKRESTSTSRSSNESREVNSDKKKKFKNNPVDKKKGKNTPFSRYRGKKPRRHSSSESKKRSSSSLSSSPHIKRKQVGRKSGSSKNTNEDRVVRTKREKDDDDKSDGSKSEIGKNERSASSQSSSPPRFRRYLERRPQRLTDRKQKRVNESDDDKKKISKPKISNDLKRKSDDDQNKTKRDSTNERGGSPSTSKERSRPSYKSFHKLDTPKRKNSTSINRLNRERKGARGISRETSVSPDHKFRTQRRGRSFSTDKEKSLDIVRRNKDKRHKDMPHRSPQMHGRLPSQKFNRKSTHLGTDTSPFSNKNRLMYLPRPNHPENRHRYENNNRNTYDKEDVSHRMDIYSHQQSSNEQIYERDNRSDEYRFQHYDSLYANDKSRNSSFSSRFRDDQRRNPDHYSDTQGSVHPLRPSPHYTLNSPHISSSVSSISLIRSSFLSPYSAAQNDELFLLKKKKEKEDFLAKRKLLQLYKEKRRMEMKLQSPFKVSRISTPPFLLRIFYKVNDAHTLSAFKKRGEEPVQDELQVYAWMDSKFREIAYLVKDVCWEARDRNALWKFRLVYPDKTGNSAIADVCTLHSTIIDRKNDEKTLHDVKFQVADFLLLSIIKLNSSRSRLHPRHYQLGESKDQLCPKAADGNNSSSSVNNVLIEKDESYFNKDDCDGEENDFNIENNLDVGDVHNVVSIDKSRNISGSREGEDTEEANIDIDEQAIDDKKHNSETNRDDEYDEFEKGKWVQGGGGMSVRKTSDGWEVIGMKEDERTDHAEKDKDCGSIKKDEKRDAIDQNRYQEYNDETHEDSCHIDSLKKNVQQSEDEDGEILSNIDSNSKEDEINESGRDLSLIHPKGKDVDGNVNSGKKMLGGNKNEKAIENNEGVKNKNNNINLSKDCCSGDAKNDDNYGNGSEEEKESIGKERKDVKNNENENHLPPSSDADNENKRFGRKEGKERDNNSSLLPETGENEIHEKTNDGKREKRRQEKQLRKNDISTRENTKKRVGKADFAKKKKEYNEKTSHQKDYESSSENEHENAISLKSTAERTSPRKRKNANKKMEKKGADMGENIKSERETRRSSRISQKH